MSSTAELIVISILGLALAVGNLVFWMRVVKREPAAMKAVEQRYGVTISRSFRGHWTVTSGQPSALKRLGIELLQLAYFMKAFAVWAVAMGLGVGMLLLVQRAF